MVGALEGGLEPIEVIIGGSRGRCDKYNAALFLGLATLACESRDLRFPLGSEALPPADGDARMSTSPFSIAVKQNALARAGAKKMIYI